MMIANIDFYNSKSQMLGIYKRKYIPFTWKIADIARLLFMFVFYSLFIPPRLNHASMMFRGLWDGILGKTGGL